MARSNFWRKASLVFGLFLCSFVAITLATNDFSAVISSLRAFQDRTGGFRSSSASGPSLQATADALFLSSLYGLRNRINTAAIPQFIAGQLNGDNGYGQFKGSPSDLESTFHAVLSYVYLGQPIPNSVQTAIFVRSLVDTRNNLFANHAGGHGNLKSTALAFQTLALLGEEKRGISKQVLDGVKKYVTDNAKSNHFEFPNEDLSFTSANYYGILAANQVGFTFSDVNAWANFILSFQSPEGGFYADSAKKTTTFEASAHAVSALNNLQTTLGTVDQASRLTNKVNGEALLQSLQYIPFDLHAASLAHLAIAPTSTFHENFKIAISYETVDSPPVRKTRIEQGTKLKPVLTVHAFGSPHAGLDASVVITHSGSSVTSPLQWAVATQNYAAEDFYDTSFLLGKLAFSFTLHQYVVGVGDISFSFSAEKEIGYGINVYAEAEHEVTHREIEEGQLVSPGTDFTFTVSLSNRTQETILSGDFTVTFAVLDSSDVIIHLEQLEGRTNTKTISFEYALRDANIPSGALSFLFQVKGANGEAHTTHIVSYQVSTNMIATEIKFKGFDEAPTYRLGDDVTISIAPASFPDLRNVHPFASVDYSGASVLNKRAFFLDITTSSGIVLQSIKGVAGENSLYQFEFTIPSTLDYIGSNVVSFRYQTVHGQSIPLANFDSTYGELYDDSSVLSFAVESNLHLADVKEQPQQGDFYYGNEIGFRFGVVDTISNNRVSQGEFGKVYMSLNHEDERHRTFTSTKIAADQIGEELVVRWQINPNAVKGDGVLILSAENADGEEISLYGANKNSKETLKHKVNIGGDIEVEHKSYSTQTLTTSQTAFVVEFGLTCRKKTLKDAKLKAFVNFVSGSHRTELLSVPVAAREDGEYSVSWTAPHAEAKSGRYELQVFREIDSQRAADNAGWREKEIERARREAELKGDQFNEAAFAAKLSESPLNPLFTVDFNHKAPTGNILPFRLEWVPFILFLVGFIWTTQKKSAYKNAK